MRRWPTLFLLLFGCAGNAAVWAGDDPDFLKALALQKVMQKTIRETEPAIACILVSRSTLYQELGQGPDRLQLGKLGAFNPQVLHVSEEKRQHYRKLLDFTDPGYLPRAYGSGVVVDADGLILTNYHVVQDATKIFVRLPGGKSSYADIHAADPRSDLAVLRLLNPAVRPLKTITLGNADKLDRGQFVLTLSNPFAAGFRDGQASASWGILSNIRRRAPAHLKEDERIKPLQYYSTLLQTDARLNLGCSGGALCNLSGEMVGLITSVAAIQGGETPGGFAVPVNTAMRRVIEVLQRGEEVDYGFLGVGFDGRTGSGDGNGRSGVVLQNLSGGGPAKRDGKLEEYDILVAIDGQPIRDIDDVFAAVGSNLAGTKVRLQVRRGGIEHLAEVTLAKLYVPGPRIVSSIANRPYFHGLRVDYTSLLVQQPLVGTHDIHSIPSGVLVSEVQSNSSAERAKLRAGDVITHVNQMAVSAPAAFYRAVTSTRGPVELTLLGVPNRVLLK